MLPNNAISDPAFPAAYLSPDDADILELESLELGGTALNDASDGREVQDWKAWIDADEIKCAPQPANTPITTLVSGAGTLTSVSIAFDSSMQPTICYIEDGVLKLRWFNTLTASFQTDSFVGATSGRVCTDDKRKYQEGQSDVIFAYTLDENLYWRQQRDRYTVERLVGVAGAKLLVGLGMNTINRLQFKLFKE